MRGRHCRGIEPGEFRGVRLSGAFGYAHRRRAIGRRNAQGVTLTLSSGRWLTLNPAQGAWARLASPGDRLRAVTSRSYLDEWRHTTTVTYSPVG